MTGAERAAWLSAFAPEEDAFATTPAAVKELQTRVMAFVADVVDEVGVDGVVVTLDGGLSSTVVATLAADAVGPDRVVGLVMPAHLSGEAAARKAETVAMALDISYSRVHLHPLLGAFQEAMGATPGPADDLVATGNALARFRTTCADYVATTTNALVLGAATRTDRLLGATEHAGTGDDCLPLGDLYRTEVTALATAVGVPDDVVAGTPGSGFVGGDFDPVEFGVEPETVDRVLRSIVDEGLGVPAVVDRTETDGDVVDRIRRRCEAAQRRRRRPLSPATTDADRSSPERVGRPNGRR